jgi:hypothetical protein
MNAAISSQLTQSIGQLSLKPGEEEIKKMLLVFLCGWTRGNEGFARKRTAGDSCFGANHRYHLRSLPGS